MSNKGDIKTVIVTEDITDRSWVRAKYEELITEEEWIFGDDYIIADIAPDITKKFKLKECQDIYYCKVFPGDDGTNKYWLYMIEKCNDKYYMYCETFASTDPKIIDYKDYELFKTAVVKHPTEQSI